MFTKRVGQLNIFFLLRIPLVLFSQYTIEHLKLKVDLLFGCREVFTRINKEDILIGELHEFDLH